MGSRRWIGVVAVASVAVIGWGAFLVMLIQTGGWASLTPAIVMTGALIVLTAGLGVLVARAKSDREVALAFIVYALLLLVGLLAR
jgi:hypothetical protein